MDKFVAARSQVRQNDMVTKEFAKRPQTKILFLCVESSLDHSV